MSRPECGLSCSFSAGEVMLGIFLSPVAIFMGGCKPGCIRTDLHHAPDCCEADTADYCAEGVDG